MVREKKEDNERNHDSNDLIGIYERIATMEVKINKIEQEVGGIFNRIEDLKKFYVQVLAKIFWGVMSGVCFPIAIFLFTEYHTSRKPESIEIRYLDEHGTTVKRTINQPLGKED